MGFFVIDCDKVAREVVEKGSPLLELLVDSFGVDILLEDGSIDRKGLAAKAFCDSEATELLNSIMLPYIRERIETMIDHCLSDGVEYLLLDAPTLYQSGLDEACQEVIAVMCDENIRKQRIIERDSLTEEQANTRLNAALPDDFYLQKTKNIIYNNGDLETFISCAENLIGELMR